MSLTLSQFVTAISPNLSTSMVGLGGVEPYAYSVVAGGAGGTIDPATGLYLAPAIVNPNPAQSFDTIVVTDATNATAQGQILVGSPLQLVCDIIQKEMGLANGRVYLWNQKIFQPDDFDLYIAVSVLRCKPFASTKDYDSSGAGLQSNQSLNVMATLSVDIMSRGPSARDRKEEVVLALNSDYAESQQEANSFLIGRLPPTAQFVNLSVVDGAAIPYRYNISVNVQYVVQKSQSVNYLSSFDVPQIAVNP